jgi:hypothetical protein
VFAVDGVCMDVDASALEEVARSVRREYLAESAVEMEWPDCYDVSLAVKRELVERGVDEGSLDIRRYMLEGEAHHYALVVEGDGELFVVDASFDQFANETGTLMDVAPMAEISEVVVVVKSQYVFSEMEG